MTRALTSHRRRKRRAVGIPAAIIACDLVLASFFTLLGRIVLMQPELWEPAD